MVQVIAFPLAYLFFAAPVGDFLVEPMQDITATIRNAAGSVTNSTIANTVSVPNDATLVLLSKDTSIYLEEDMSIYLAASVAGDLSATCSYDEIS